MFAYKAIDQSGRTVRGQLQAVNETELELRLEQMGLDVINLYVMKNTSRWLAGQRVSQKDLALFCFQLETLLSAGVPLLDALNEVRDNSDNPYFQKTLATIINDIHGGKMFSQALSDQQSVFNEIFISLVVAGEHSGELATVLRHLFETLRWQDELTSQTKKLLLYPAFTGVVVLGVVAFLMTYLVPQMTAFLTQIGYPLPLQTRFLIALSSFMVDYALFLLFGIVLLSGLALYAIKYSDAVADYWAHLKFKLPIFGKIIHKAVMARFSRYFALLYHAGIPILDAMKICERIVANRVIATSLDHARARINSGATMSSSLRDSGLFSPLVIRMISVGESTGTLDKALLNVSYFYDREIKEAIDKLLVMIEPLLTVTLGLILAFIMFAVLDPVYNSFSQLKI